MVGSLVTWFKTTSLGPRVRSLVGSSCHHTPLSSPPGTPSLTTTSISRTSSCVVLTFRPPHRTRTLSRKTSSTLITSPSLSVPLTMVSGTKTSCPFNMKSQKSSVPPSRLFVTSTVHPNQTKPKGYITDNTSVVISQETSCLS